MNQISSEFKIPKILDYLPVVSTFTGLVRLFMLAHQKTQARQGVLVAKVSKSWGDQTGKRGAIALIPVIGNLILGIHDLKKSAKDRMINNIVNSEKELIENLELTDKIVNPFIKDWDEFDKELSTIVYPAICSEKKLLSGAGMKVQIYDAYACFLSEKVYRKSTLEDYQLQTYIKYACCIARLLKCQNNHSSMLNQINSLGD